MVLISCLELHCVFWFLCIIVIDSALIKITDDYETERCLRVPDSTLAEVFLCILNFVFLLQHLWDSFGYTI